MVTRAEVEHDALDARVDHPGLLRNELAEPRPQHGRGDRDCHHDKGDELSVGHGAITSASESSCFTRMTWNVMSVRTKTATSRSPDDGSRPVETCI